jgi:hypothetical protein
MFRAVIKGLCLGCSRAHFGYRPEIFCAKRLAGGNGGQTESKCSGIPNDRCGNPTYRNLSKQTQTHN